MSRGAPRGLAASALAVLAGALLAVLTAWTLPAQAEVLVSNMSKTNADHSLRVGVGPIELLGGGYVVPWTHYERGWPWVTYTSQSFRTGSHAAGYRLEAVVVDLLTEGQYERAFFRAYVSSRTTWSRDRSKYVPGRDLFTLNLRAARNGRVYLDARTEHGEYPKLEPNTHYFVKFVPHTTGPVLFQWTESDGEDPGRAPGWSIGDTSHSYVAARPLALERGLAKTFYDPSIKIEINGTAIAGGAPVMDGGTGDISTGRSVAENAAPGTNVGAPITATDPDGDTLTYRLEGRDARAFEVDAASGQIRTVAGVTLRQSVGASSSGGVDALLGRGTLEDVAAKDDGHDLDRRTLELRLGYGFGVLGDGFTATPEVGVGLSDAQREYRLGWRLGLEHSGPVSMELKLETSRLEHVNESADPEHGVGLRMTARW